MGLFKKKKKKETLDAPPTPPSFMRSKHVESNIPTKKEELPPIKAEHPVTKENNFPNFNQKDNSKLNFPNTKKDNFAIPKENNFNPSKNSLESNNLNNQFNSNDNLNNFSAKQKQELFNEPKELTKKDKPKFKTIKQSQLKKISEINVPELHKPDVRKVENGPIFVKVDDYRMMLDEVGKVKNDVKTAQASMENLKNLKNVQEMEIDKWKEEIEDLQKKLMFVDKILFEGA